MHDHSPLRRSRLPSMGSQPCLLRPSICKSLEPTEPSARACPRWGEFPSRGAVCAFSQRRPKISPVLLYETDGPSHLFLLSPPLLFGPSSERKDLLLIFLPACYYLVAHPVGNAPPAPKDAVSASIPMKLCSSNYARASKPRKDAANCVNA